MKFLALDFETANRYNNSACALGLVRVEDGAITAYESVLIRPPQRLFEFTHIHGISWHNVASAPTFGELWHHLKPYWDGIDFATAHNAPFDRRVLRGCCEHFNLAVPNAPFICTVQVARNVWNIRPTRLPDVCCRLNIPLKHHDAMSDTFACAAIMMQALQAGYSIHTTLRKYSHGN